MENRLCSFIKVAIFYLAGVACSAQVLPLGKVSDPVARVLQQHYGAQLQQLSADVSALHFQYPFYLSQVLDIDEARQKQLPLGSIRFDKFNGQTVLAMTGNYYISYSSAMLTGNQRARRTFEDVVMPLLKAAVARIDRTVPFDGYAFEVSHHIRKVVLKVDTEGAENLMVFVPRGVAERLARAGDAESMQAALLESETYLNGELFSLWLTGDDAPADVNDRYRARHDQGTATRKTLADEPVEPGTLINPRLVPESELLNQIKQQKNTPHEVSALQLQKLQTTYEATLQRLTADLKPQAHFVDYAPPAFVAFRDGAYLQLNMNTELEQPAGSSQYRVAALAFDSHVAHTLRAVAAYFHDHPQFDGVDFSTTVHQPNQSASQSVEFVVPFSVLLCYEKFDCTGQELINRSVVLINGERVTLDLQRAETEYQAH